MTDFLRLNGISVPVAVASSPDAGQETIGAMRRGVNSSAVVPRRARKGVWKVGTTPVIASKAFAWRELVAGAGHVVNFDALNPYTSKGMAPVSVAGGWSYTGTGPKYGAGCASWTTGNALWAFFVSGAPWTIAYWLNVGGGGYHHVVTRSDGQSWFDGSTAWSLPVGWGSVTEGFGGVASGVATFGSTSASKIDDIVALPYLVPDDWPPQMYGFGSAFGLLPALTADGRVIELNTKTSVVGGEASSKISRGKDGGQLVDLYNFSFQLNQV